jgi:hypothetical protein
MRRLLQLAALLFLCVGWASATNWYVNPTTGGTRYSASNTSGQCNGQSNSAYVSGTNQACPYNDARLLFNDPSVYGALGWVISGGDTVLISGYEQSTGLVGAIAGNSGGICPGVAYCAMPSVPSGTSGAHTRILGANYASCGTHVYGGDPAKLENFTVASSGSVAAAVDASQYVDLECLHIDGRGGSLVGIGLFTGNIGSPRTAANITLNNLTIQGFNTGISGSIAGLFTVNDVWLYMNGSSGWNLDDGTAYPSTGSIVSSYLAIDWSGSREEDPIVHAIPVANGGSHDDLGGGYGDGFGTPATHLDVSLDHARFSYNTQDGFDMTHGSDSTVIVTNSVAFGNMGGSIKIGAENIATRYNNTLMNNCQRMHDPITGAQTGYNTNLSDFCRAAGDQTPLSFMTTAQFIGSAYAVGTAVTGTDTHFTTQVSIGDVVAPVDFPFSTYGGITVTHITDDLHITVSSSYPTNWGSSGSPLHFVYIPGGTPSSSSVVTVYHDTNIGYGATVIDGGCGTGTVAGGGYNFVGADPSYCPGVQVLFKNNIMLGILNTVCGANPGCGSGTAVPGMWAGGITPTTQDYNLYYNLQSNSGLCVGAHDICASNPLFVSQPANSITAESQLDNYNFNLSSSSGAIAAGVTIAGQTADQAGVSWASPPSIGALQYGSSPGPTYTVILGGKVYGGTIP